MKIDSRKKVVCNRESQNDLFTSKNACKCINILVIRCLGMFRDKKTALWYCTLSTKCQRGTTLSHKQPKNGPVTIIAPCQKIKWGPYFQFLGPQINFPCILGVLALRENYYFIPFCNTFPPFLFFDKEST